MNIVFSEKYKLTSDELNIMVHKKKVIDPTKSPNWAKLQAEGADPTPRQEWSDPISYHGTIEQAVNSIINREIRLSDAESLRELISDISEIKMAVKEALK